MYFIIGGDGKQYGPISNEELRKWVVEGRLNAQSMAKGENDADFRPLSAFAEFTDLFLPKTPLQVGPSTLADANAAQSIKIPAIALIVIASLGILYYIFNTVVVLMGGNGPAPHPANMSPQMQQFMESFEKGQHGPMAVAVSLLIMAINGFVLFGSIKMLKLQNYGVAVAAAVLAMLPCIGCCCIFGLPFGIWALVVLNKPEVKSQFA